MVIRVSANRKISNGVHVRFALHRMIKKNVLSFSSKGKNQTQITMLGIWKYLFGKIEIKKKNLKNKELLKIKDKYILKMYSIH